MPFDSNNPYLGDNPILSLNDDPERAARADQLSRATGAGPATVYGDLDHFDDQLKVSIASSIIKDDPYIQKYLQSSPLAAKVSNDDLATLNGISRGAELLRQPSGFVQGFKEGFDYEGLEAEYKKLFDLVDDPKWRALVQVSGAGGALVAVGGALRLPGAVMTGIAGSLGQAYTNLFGSSAWGNRFGRDMLAAMQVGLAGQSGLAGPGGAMRFNAAVKPFLRAGREPLPGVDPVVDRMKVQQATADMKALADVTSQAQTSTTRERAPELFKEYAQEVVGDAAVGIPVDIATQLGEQLNFVPKLEEQLARANLTGGDVQIPMADWLTYAPPELMAVVKDHLRVRPEGVTVEEGKALGQISERELVQLDANGEALQAVRNAAGLQPEPFTKPQSWMTADQYARYQKKLEAQHAADEEAALERATNAQRKRQSPEWAAKRREVQKEVSEDFANRGTFAADDYFRDGMLYGKQVSAPAPKLGREFLSEEAQAVLPQSFLSKTGIDPELVAGLFGYPGGQEMVYDLAQLHQERQASGMNAPAFRRAALEAKIDEVMEARHGDFGEQVLEAAKEQALAESQMQVLHEKTLALAEKVGAQFPITREQFVKAVNEGFDSSLLKEVSSDRLLRDAGKAFRAYTDAALRGDFAEMFRQQQRHYIASEFAKRAVKLEGELEKFAKETTRLSKREVPSLPAEYTNWIHDILLRTGHGLKRSVQDLMAEITAGEHKSLADFVAAKTADLREMPVAPFLLDPTFQTKLNDLSVSDFRALRDSIKTMAKNGRDELKIVKAGNEADLIEIKGKMIDELKTFAEKHYDAEGRRWLGPVPPAIAKPLRTYLASHLQVESLFNRWDRGDPNGVFQQYIMRDLAASANSEAALERHISQRIKAVKDDANLKEIVPNDLFKDPFNGTPIQLNRKNFRAILLNVGNASNFDKLVRGYGLEHGQVLDWLMRTATKADWDWAQSIGDIFAEIKGHSDRMYRELSGVAPEAIEIAPIDTPHGQYAGWYYPVIYHPIFEGASKKLMGGDPLEQNNYVRATTPAGYTKGRTGYVAPIALSLDAMPGRMRQMIHDISMRPAVINAAKIFYDKDFRAAVSKHYGSEYRNMLVDYLRDVANSANRRTEAQATWERVSEFIRQNMISTLVGLNPGTVLKHGPTAAVQSLMEVGPANFLKAVNGLFSVNEATGQSNWRFAMEKSEELQRRHRHYRETLGAATEELVPESTFGSIREGLIRFGSAPVAFSDLLSAVPTWLAAYEKGMREGMEPGDAVAYGDRSIRRAHGSTAITSRPAVARGGALSQWLASLYGFFNHIMNRQFELGWKAKDTLGYLKEGDYETARKYVPELTAGLFAYIIFPAMVEEMVTPLPDKHHESWGVKAAKGLTYTLSSSWIGLRDMVSAMLRGSDPSAGLISTGYKTVSDLAREITKDKPMSSERAGLLLQRGATTIGALTGLTNAAEGKAARFMMNYMSGKERPKDPWGFATGLRFGTLKHHSRGFSDYLEGKVR